MLTPPGPTNSPTTIKTMPQSTAPRKIVTIPAITNTWGGLRIDDQARVLDADGAPIPGLLAAGADAGGLYQRAYGGGLAAGLTLGLRAVRTALPVASR